MQVWALHWNMKGMPVIIPRKKSVLPPSATINCQQVVSNKWDLENLSDPCQNLLQALCIFCGFISAVASPCLRAFHSIPPHPLILTLFLSCLIECYLSAGRCEGVWEVVIKMSHLGLSTYSLLLSALRQIMSLCVDFCPLQKEASLAKVQISQGLWVYKHKYL